VSPILALTAAHTHTPALSSGRPSSSLSHCNLGRRHRVCIRTPSEGRGVASRAGIGYNCVLTMNIRKAKSRLRGNVQALYIIAKYQGSRFEFVFTSLVKNSPRLFTTVQSVLK
jgi:hypothetical protein